MNSDRLAAALLRLIEEGGNDNRLVLQQGHAWFVASAARGGTSLNVDAAASHYLDKRQKLDAEGTNQLRSRGYAPNPPLRCLRRSYPAGELKRAAQEMLALLGGLYEAKGPHEMSLDLGDRDETRNPRLIRAMTETATKRDQEARFKLYRALLGATLLVPVEGDEPRVIGDLSGFEVFGCFTDATMAERYEPRGLRLLHIDGRDLASRLLQRKVGSLLINPGGTCRGELYRNEIESLASPLSLARSPASD